MAAKLVRIEREVGELAELAERRAEERRAEREEVGSDERAARARRLAQDRAARAARADRAAPTAPPRRCSPSSSATPAIGEAVALSTCNRTELYLVVARPGGGREPSCSRSSPAAPASGRPSCSTAIYSLRNCDAARHLYRVTSGLESMVVGEAEVQGQVKRAYELALSARTTGPMTNKLFRAALATGKRVRTETAISDGPRERRLGRRRRRARRARRPGRAPRADRRRRRDRRADRPGAARAGRQHDVRRQPPARARDRARAALRRRVRLVRRAARRARAGRHRHRLDLLAAHADRRRGARRR